MAAGWGLVNELFMIVSAVAAAFGWAAIRRNRVHLHRKLMITASVFGALFFVSYALATLIIGDTSFGGPAGIAGAYNAFLQVHVMLATAAAVLGVITLTLAARRRFRKHKRVAPWTAVMWFISAGTGLVVYLMLFVIFPSGPTIKNLIHLLFKS
ncbi:MAG: DUF420 domain-containing protein [Bacilli bacterium]